MIAVEDGVDEEWLGAPPLEEIESSDDDEGEDRGRRRMGIPGSDSDSDDDRDLHPDDDIVFLDETSAGQILTNVLTRERALVPPGGPWTLLFEEGVAGLVDNSGNDVHATMSIFKKQLYLESSGELVVKQQTDSTRPRQEWSLTQQLRDFKIKTVVVKSSPAKDLFIPIDILNWRRQNCAFYWSLQQFYKDLEMVSYKKSLRSGFTNPLTRGNESSLPLTFLPNTSC